MIEVHLYVSILAGVRFQRDQIQAARCHLAAAASRLIVAVVPRRIWWVTRVVAPTERRIMPAFA